MSNYTVPDLVMKFTSRKFLICVAAFLLSLGAGLSGLDQGNTRLTMVGAICCVVAAAIYAACEAYTDGKALEANQTLTEVQQVSTVNTHNSVTGTTSDKVLVGTMVENTVQKPVE